MTSSLVLYAWTGLLVTILDAKSIGVDVDLLLEPRDDIVVRGEQSGLHEGVGGQVSAANEDQHDRVTLGRLRKAATKTFIFASVRLHVDLLTARCAAIRRWRDGIELSHRPTRLARCHL